eukprot:TRINITY_DN18626_c0_g1_i1.p1 TRINITY_DN18626_c0_g1~~TRINITY_DN18626_c0_g1_i1.p1  ORF type:complete len:269 (-),score=49.59 TRINITY_DN18626_c0_g1_i1:85-891(-)
MAGTPKSLHKAIHGDISSKVLPAVLILAAMSLLIYAHSRPDGDYASKVFLGLILIQILPLAFLEFKVVTCPDPVGMLSLFGTKVLLLHGCFLLLRVLAWPLMEVGFGWSNAIGLVSVLVILKLGFRFKLESFSSHLDVLGLVVLAGAAALVTEMLDFGSTHSFLEQTIHTSSSYIEILGFVPAVWMVYQSAKKSDDVTGTGGANLWQQTGLFCTFLISFYVFEDLATAWHIRSLSALAAAGHIVHFLMLAHFVSFLIYQVSRQDMVML